MKKLPLIRAVILHGFSLAAATLCAQLSAGAQLPNAATSRSAPIPVDQLGAVAGKQYHGDGLSVAATPDGARLRCEFQQLEGLATGEGLWLNSTAATSKGERFRVVASAVSREGETVRPPAPLPISGSVTVAGSLARFSRPGLTEEYSVSMDGVRQDFIVAQRPDGDGKLRVELALTGARAESLAKGARLVLAGSGRKLAYSRLRVVDANGKELASRMQVMNESRLALVVNDAAAVYPVRIDPTFSDEDWGSMGGLLGADEFVSAAVADGAGNLYIGGYFTVVGDVRANYVAKWDGSEWSDLGGGVDYSVWSLAVSGTDVYVAGDFSWAGETETANGIPANRIAKWDGTNWSALGSGIGEEPGFDVWDYVAALAVIGTDVYAGGYFETAGDGVAANIAKWNGTTWSALGSGMDGDVYALAVIGTTLYAGGYFTTAGGTPAANIARWNGSAWFPLGEGMDDSVQALAVRGTTLFAGGDFNTAGGIDAYYIAQWNGSTWSALGWGVDARVSALAVSGTDLYAGGWFSTAGETTDASYVAKWDGSTWSALGDGVDDYVNALAMVGNTFYVGGDFEFVGGHYELVEGFPELVGQKLASYIAKWDGTDWSALGSGLSGFVYSLAVSGTSLYAGGDFSTADVNPANNIARWNGSAWSALGSGMDDAVFALAVSGSDLYAGGWFQKAGGTEAINIAKWNGNAWSALGAGLNSTVSALAMSDSGLYAGGGFTMSGETEMGGIARWNGNVWSAVGEGLVGSVSALAAAGMDVYAGGSFVAAGSIPVNYIARWNGSAWSGMGEGMNGFVHALAVVGSDVYAGGSYSTAGEVAANGIARWDGSTWSALGSGVDDGFVSALAVSGTDLYVGGSFTTAGGNPANSIAKWDGGAWSALGSGTGASIYALAVFGTDLYAGGDFISIGNKVSAYAAKAKISASSGPTPRFSVARSNGALIISWPSASTGFELQQNSGLNPANWTTPSETIGNNGTTRFITVNPAAGSRFFRMVKQ